jgi:hypothetical protein
MISGVPRTSSSCLPLLSRYCLPTKSAIWSTAPTSVVVGRQPDQGPGCFGVFSVATWTPTPMTATAMTASAP